MTEKISVFCLVFSGALLGFFASIAVKATHIKFDGTITLGNAVQAGASVLLGIAVATFITRYTQADRKEKDILLARLDAILKLVEAFEELKSGQASIEEITSSLRRIRATCRQLRETLIRCRYSSHIISRADFEPELRPLRDATTLTPVSSATASPEITIQNNIVTWTDGRRALIEAEVHKIKSRIFDLQVDINKS